MKCVLMKVVVSQLAFDIAVALIDVKTTVPKRQKREAKITKDQNFSDRQVRIGQGLAEIAAGAAADDENARTISAAETLCRCRPRY